MIKWVFLGLSFIFAKYTNALRKPGLVTLEHISFVTRRIILVGVLSLVAAGLLGGGIIISVFNIFSHYHATGTFELSGATVAGLILFLIGAGVFTMVYNLRPVLYPSIYRGQSGWQRFFSRAPRQAQSPLEEAISLLLRDYLRNREMRRDFRHQAMEQNHDQDTNDTPSSSRPMAFTHKRSFRPRPSAV